MINKYITVRQYVKTAVTALTQRLAVTKYSSEY